MKNFILSGLLLSFYSVQLMATDYFVSKTEANGYHSIQDAVDTAQAGDTIYIKSGIYNERVYLEASGTKANPIVIKNFANDKVVIDGNGIVWEGTWGGLLDISEISYIHILGLDVINSRNAAIFLDNSTNITIENTKTHNSYSSGIGVWYSNNIVLKNNEISLACNNGAQESITIADSHDVIVSKNEVHHNGPGTNGGEGIDVKMGSYNVLVERNHIHHLNNRPGLYADAWDKHTFNIKFDSNIVHDCSHSGMLIASEMGGLIEHVSFVNNIVHHNSEGGIGIGGWSADSSIVYNPVEHINILHNTFYANKGDGIYMDNPDVKNIKIYNNIIADNKESQISIDDNNVPLNEVDIKSNVVMGNLAWYNHSYDIVANPDFVNPEAKDFHLKVNSPAISAGIATNVRYDFDQKARAKNVPSDIGAYVYVPSIVTTNLLKRQMPLNNTRRIRMKTNDDGSTTISAKAKKAYTYIRLSKKGRKGGLTRHLIAGEKITIKIKAKSSATSSYIRSPYLDFSKTKFKKIDTYQEFVFHTTVKRNINKKAWLRLYIKGKGNTITVKDIEISEF